MNSADWIDAETACALLGVRSQTLYAYVSRKLLRVQADTTDGRRSLYAKADVEALAQQNRRPRARAEVAEAAIRWGDPVLVTAISELRQGMLWLRGRSVGDCAETMTLEEMAAHLWQVDAVECPDVSGASSLSTPVGRAMDFLVHMTGEGTAIDSRAADDWAPLGGRLMSGVTNALLARDLGGPIHLRLGRAWQASDAAADDLRRALVLLSDHELNPSTFAVRIAASTGASLPAALLSGLATLSGPRHGGAATQARAALKAALDGEAETFLKARQDQSPYGFGFGHPLYPDGDPRARLLLERLPADAAPLRAVGALSQRLGLPANIDMALTAMSMVHHLPEDAAFTIFAAGRLAGWIGHAIEQAESGDIIRPRARYQR
ncbi:citrate synthase family protein [Pleomorphomonas sp. PLEO]|uniref:citrate synthase family protein n=1 Tax=Pleomorphomonas sp. PLEO TaxID=3239306 RepID=UPI00351E2039